MGGAGGSTRLGAAHLASIHTSRTDQNSKTALQQCQFTLSFREISSVKFEAIWAYLRESREMTFSSGWLRGGRRQHWEFCRGAALRYVRALIKENILHNMCLDLMLPIWSLLLNTAYRAETVKCGESKISACVTTEQNYWRLLWYKELHAEEISEVIIENIKVI